MAERARVTWAAVYLPQQARTRARVTWLEVEANIGSAGLDDRAIVTWMELEVPDGRGLGIRDTRPLSQWVRPMELLPLAPFEDD